jgi:hypothetical protein
VFTLEKDGENAFDGAAAARRMQRVAMAATP